MFVNSPSLMHNPLHSTYLYLVREYSVTRQANVYMRHRWMNGNCAFVCCVSNTHASTSIKGFMAFYRQTFPQVSEDRMWVSWQAGCRKCTLLEPTYSSVSDRLKYVEHYLHVHIAPTFMESCPFPTRRRRKTEWLPFTSGKTSI